MKDDNQNVSRRRFLGAGSAAVAASVLLSADKIRAAPTSEKSSQNVANVNNRAMLATTEYIDIRDAPSFPSSGVNITAAINWAINELSGASTKQGGQILIPRGTWESSGGHLLKDSISIEGVGYNHNYPSYLQMGTIIKMTGGGATPMFKITGAGISSDGIRSCSLKNLAVDMSSNSSAIGLLMENDSSKIIYGTYLENVAFYNGAYGVYVNSILGDFECILNRFDRVSFLGCAKAFSCNSINGGYAFKNCYFSIPQNGTALNCVTIGNLSVESCLFVGNPKAAPNTPTTNNTTILRTEREFNNISFYDCQDESVQYGYQNIGNYYDQVPLVYRNCLVQSLLEFKGPGSVVFDSCRLNVTNAIMQVRDSTVATPTSPLGGFVRVILEGLNNVFWQAGSVTKFDNFSNYYSKIIGGDPELTPSGTTGMVMIRRNRGTVNIAAGNNQIVVQSPHVSTNVLVHAFLRTIDSGGATIKSCIPAQGSFTITLSQAAAANLSIGFVIEV